MVFWCIPALKSYTPDVLGAHISHGDDFGALQDDPVTSVELWLRRWVLRKLRVACDPQLSASAAGYFLLLWPSEIFLLSTEKSIAGAR